MRKRERMLSQPMMYRIMRMPEVFEQFAVAHVDLSGQPLTVGEYTVITASSICCDGDRVWKGYGTILQGERDIKEQVVQEVEGEAFLWHDRWQP